MTHESNEARAAAFRAAIEDADRLLGAIAHQVGAAMLPSPTSAPELEGHRAWRRLAFVTNALADHVRGEKRALDQLRGAPSMDAEPMDAAEWMTWFPELLGGLVNRERCRVAYALDGPIPSTFPRAVLLLLVWTRTCGRGRDVEVLVEGADGAFRARVTGLPEGCAPVPDALSRAWSSVSTDTARQEDGVLLLGPQAA